ncbi:MAG: hypothetical protein AAGF88_10785 [Pseudomonadota bacterium]
MSPNTAENRPSRNIPRDAALPQSHEEAVDGHGVVTVIEDFLPGLDRLLLDFDSNVLPQITLDMSVEAGSTAVMGNGHLMVVLRGATGVAVSDVETRMSDGSEAWETDTAEDDDGVCFIADFDPAEDVIEVLYDPGTLTKHSIKVTDFEDGTGANIFFNGKLVLSVSGAQGIDPADIQLVQRNDPVSH